MARFSPRKIALVVVRACVATALVSAFFVLAQDFLIFPGMLDSRLSDRVQVPPPPIDEFKVPAQDGQEVTVWRAEVPPAEEKGTALLFHGNGESVSSFLRIQGWLQELGISSYSVEFRGYNGRASGWPSEQGLYADADAAFTLLSKQRNGALKNFLVLGSSIGTGVASYVAEKYSPTLLVLLSPYTSLPAAVRDTPFFGFLSPFVRYSFPTALRLANLTSTAVIIAHGKRDSTIPFSHSMELQRAYRGTGRLEFIVSEESGHNDLLAHTHQQIAQAINSIIH